MIIDGIPLRVKKTKNKLQSLNLNNYRNNQYYLNNSMKKAFESQFLSLCNEHDICCPDPPLELTFTLFRNSNRKIDLSNVCSIVDKFVSDALVKNGIIADDNVEIIKAIRYIDGGIDKNNPRAKLEIKHYAGE